MIIIRMTNVKKQIQCLKTINKQVIQLVEQTEQPQTEHKTTHQANTYGEIYNNTKTDMITRRRSYTRKYHLRGGKTNNNTTINIINTSTHETQTYINHI